MELFSELSLWIISDLLSKLISQNRSRGWKSVLTGHKTESNWSLIIILIHSSRPKESTQANRQQICSQPFSDASEINKPESQDIFSDNVVDDVVQDCNNTPVKLNKEDALELLRKAGSLADAAKFAVEKVLGAEVKDLEYEDVQKITKVIYAVKAKFIRLKRACKDKKFTYGSANWLSFLLWRSQVD